MITRDDIALIFQNTDFDRLRGARILITGGSGFVGHWMSVVPHWLPVKALNHTQYDYGNWHRQDWDYIFHFANVPPQRVMECAKRNNATILYSSSGSVVTDKDPGDYTRGKILAEDDLLNSGLDVRIARMYTFAGGFMKNHFAVVNMIYDAISGSTLRIRSSKPTVTRSYLYAADMAVWLWRILLSGSKGCIYEVGSPHPVNMEALARQVQKNFTPPPLIEHEPMFFNEPRPYYVPQDLDRTMKELDLQVYTPFEEAITRTVKHYLEEADCSTVEYWRGV